MKKPLILGNWKMNKNIEESVELIRKLRAEGIDGIENAETVIAPSYLAIAPVCQACEGSVIQLAAQHVSFMQGNYCGEISPDMLSGLCRYAVKGHSERRIYFGDTDETVNRRLAACLEAGITPVLCTGDTKEEMEAARTEEAVERQLARGLNGVEDPSGVVVLYEPVWALGTGVSPAGGKAGDIIGGIRRKIARLYDEKTAQDVRLIYAGSVRPENAAEFIAQPEIDGLAVGTASLFADRFLEIIRTVSNIYRSAEQRR